MRKIVSLIIFQIVILSLCFSASLREDHIIRLKTDIANNEPAFQFEFTSGMRFPEFDSNIVTNKAANLYSPNASYNEFGTEETAIEVEDISRNDLNLLFTVYLANDAKSKNTYKLSLNAGGFAVTRFNIPGTVEPKSVTIIPAGDIDARLGVSAGTIVEGSSIDMCFNGAKCSAGKLALFEVFYQKDGTIDPSNGDAYYANITLEISSNS